MVATYSSMTPSSPSLSPDCPDAVLLTASRAGDLAAFALLVERYQDVVCAIAYNYVGDRAASEDIAQDAFLALWSAIVKIREPDKVRAWLCNTARNLAKTRGRRRRHETLADDHDTAAADNPYDTLADQQERSLVWAALERVPPSYREPLVLYYRDGNSVERVAAMLGLSVEAAQKRLVRGREELRGEVERVERHLPRTRTRAGFATAVLAALVAKRGDAAAATHTAVWWVIALIGAILVGGTLWVVRRGGTASIRQRAVAAQTESPKRAPSAVPLARPASVVESSPPSETGTLRIEGLVVDSNDQPVAGATVVVASNPPRIVTCEDDGSFVVERLLPRTYRFVANAGAVSSQPVSVLATEETEPVILRLRRGWSLDVTVLEERTGKPVPGATVTIAGRDRVSDDHGKARIDGIVAPSLLAVRAPQFGSSFEFIRMTADDAAVHRTIYLDIAHRASGIVRGPDGTPVASATVAAVDRNGVAIESVQTDLAGRWQHDELTAETYTFVATVADIGTSRSRPVDLTGVEAMTGIELAIEADTLVVGHVVDLAGHPVSAATVELFDGDITHRVTASSDRDGRFTIHGPAAGKIEIFASRYPAASKIETRELTRGVRPNEITLTIAPHLIRGVVKIGDEPAAGVQVGAVGTQIADGLFRHLIPRAEDVTNSRGEFVLGPLPEGDYVLRTSRPGFEATELAQLTTPARTGDDHVTIALPVTGRLIGEVVRADGHPIDDVSFTISTFAAGLAFSTPTPLATAQFQIERLTDGTYVIGLSGPGVERKLVENVVIHAGQTTDVGTIRLDTGRTVTGRVIDRDGKGVPNARVIVGRSLRSGLVNTALAIQTGAQVVRSDAGGRFRVAGLDSNPETDIALAVTPVGRSAPIQTGATEGAELVLVVEPTGKLTGTVSIAGKPAIHATVTVSMPGVSEFTRTNDTGSYSFPRLGAGDYCVEVATDLIAEPAGKTCPVAVSSGGNTVRDLAY